MDKNPPMPHSSINGGLTTTSNTDKTNHIFVALSSSKRQTRQCELKAVSFSFHVWKKTYLHPFMLFLSFVLALSCLIFTALSRWALNMIHLRVQNCPWKTNIAQVASTDFHWNAEKIGKQLQAAKDSASSPLLGLFSIWGKTWNSAVSRTSPTIICW